MGHEEHESLIETLNILSDSDTMAAIEEAEADLAAGHIVDLAAEPGSCTEQGPAVREPDRTGQEPASTFTLYKIETREEQDALIAKTLAEAGTTAAELRRQGIKGRFESELLRRTWFIAKGLGAV